MWTLETQVEKQGKNEIEVLCKHIRFFPKLGSTGLVEGFGKLKPLVLGVLIRNEKGYDLKITMCIYNGHTSYTITHPDTMGKPTIVVGQGKTRRTVRLEHADDVKIAGLKEKYQWQADFNKRILKLAGPELLAEITEAFAERLGDIMGKRLLKLAA